MKKRKIVIGVIAVVLAAVTITSLIMCNSKESKMAVFESREQFAEWLVAEDYGAAPSRFNSMFGGYPDLEADVSYLVPLIKEYGIPTFTCDDGELSYDGYITLSPYAQSDFREQQMIFNLTLNGYEYTVYATYINDGFRDLYENAENLGINLNNYLESQYRLHSPKEIEYDGRIYTFYESEEYKIVLKSFFTGKQVTDCVTWGFISENIVYRIAFEPGEHKENYNAMVAEIPKLKPVVIPYDEFVGSGVE